MHSENKIHCVSDHLCSTPVYLGFYLHVPNNRFIFLPALVVPNAITDLSIFGQVPNIRFSVLRVPFHFVSLKRLIGTFDPIYLYVIYAFWTLNSFFTWTVCVQTFDWVSEHHLPVPVSRFILCQDSLKHLIHYKWTLFSCSKRSIHFLLDMHEFNIFVSHLPVTNIQFIILWTSNIGFSMFGHHLNLLKILFIFFVDINICHSIFGHHLHV